jgi:hypothetical protein
MKNNIKLPLLMVLIFSQGNDYAFADEPKSSLEEPFVYENKPKELTITHDEFDDDDADFLDDLAADDCVKTVPHKDQKVTYNLETVQLAALYVWHVYVVNSYCSCRNWIANFFKTPHLFKPSSSK